MYIECCTLLKALIDLDLEACYLVKISNLSNFRPFADDNNKAIEEIWYKRAVDYDTKNPNAFVYSVPFNIGAVHVISNHELLLRSSCRYFVVRCFKILAYI